jgi:hypothetical protein
LWKQPSTLLIGEAVEHFEADDAFALMVHGVSTAIEAGESTIFPATSSLRAAEIADAIVGFKN